MVALGNGTPQVSVVIPSYNRADLLRRTLSALRGQESDRFEVVVVDHGSTDHTSDVIREFNDTPWLTKLYLDRHADSPGVPKHAGACSASGQVYCFLDCGMVVTPRYVDAHWEAVHNMGSVGIGLCHGHDPYGAIDRSLLDATAQVVIERGIDRLDPELLTTKDVRSGCSVSELQLPWGVAWGGNISMPASAYWHSGGWQINNEFGFDDIDFGYRLYRSGWPFTMVEDGWGFDLPHDRLPAGDRRNLEIEGWSRAYARYRSLGLEAYRFGDDNDLDNEALFRYLSNIGQNVCRKRALQLPTMLETDASVLVIGGSPQDSLLAESVTLFDEKIESTDSLISCGGLYMPMPDCRYDVGIVGETWKWLYAFPGARPGLLLDQLDSELARTCKRAVYLDCEGAGPRDLDIAKASAYLAARCGTRAGSHTIVASTVKKTRE